MKNKSIVFWLLYSSISIFSCHTSTREVKSINSNLPVVKYLALGDSYTIGESVAKAECYPILLEKKLETDGYEVKTIIIAQTGWRTDNLAAAIEQANLKDTFELVSLLIGVNDQFQGKTIGSYSNNFEQLLQKAIELAGGNKEHVFVLSIPDYGYTPFGQKRQEVISNEIDEFNSIKKAITQKYGVDWFDITPISRQGLEQPILVATDGLHPSGKMYQQWVELIADTVKKEFHIDK